MLWLLYTILVVLNFLDYATTADLLSHVRTHEEYNYAPLWKRTRFGKWCIRHHLTGPPTMRKIEWWEHEINPFGQWLLRRFDVWGLAVVKGLALGPIAIMVATTPMPTLTAGVLLLLIDLYLFVVSHNFAEVSKCRSAPPVVRSVS